MKLHLIISCINPAIITINNDKKYVYDDNKKINVTLDAIDCFYITVNTINDNQCKNNDFTTKFTIKANTLLPNKLANIINHQNSTYEIILLNKPLIASTLPNPLATNQLLLVENNTLKIIENSKIISTKPLQSTYPFASTDTQNNTTILFSHTKSHKNICLINNDTILEFSNADYIKMDNELKIITHLNTYAKHIRVNVFDAISLERKETFVAKKNTKRYTNEYVIPYAFLQNILVGDYKEAISYLDENLKKSLQKGHLRLFFGDFVQISVPKDYATTNAVTLVYRDTNNYFTTKTFSFTIQNGIITNISV